MAYTIAYIINRKSCQKQNKSFVLKKKINCSESIICLLGIPFLWVLFCPCFPWNSFVKGLPYILCLVSQVFSMASGSIYILIVQVTYKLNHHLNNFIWMFHDSHSKLSTFKMKPTVLLLNGTIVHPTAHTRNLGIN